MHPILFTLRLSPESAQIAGLVATVLLSAFIVWDGLRTKGRARLYSILAQAAGFLIFGIFVSCALLVRERLPETVVLDIRSWGIFTILGMVSCFLVQRHLGQKIGMTSEQILSLWVYGGVGAMIGARLLHVLVNWSYYEKAPLGALAFWDGGMVYVGGVTASLVPAVLYARREKLGLAAFDVLALGVALTQGIGRIGCFLAGCCYGKETSLPWAVRFPVGSIAHFTMQQTGEIAPDALYTPWLHPTELYEAAACFLMGFMLLAWYKKGSQRPGAIICGYFIAYSSIRFVIEMLRNDPERQAYFGLSTSQIAGIVLSLAAVFVLRKIQRGAPPASLREQAV